MTEERAIVNCFSFAFHEPGSREEESYVKPPTYRQLRRDFYRVYDVASADLIALVAPDPKRVKFVVVKHVIRIEAGKQTVAHRPEPNADVRQGFLEDAMREYDKYDDLEPVLLARRKTR